MSGNHIQFIFACVALLAANFTSHGLEFAGGTGTPGDPYQITTAEQLIGMGDANDLYDKHFVLVADIDLDPTLPGRKVFEEAVIPVFARVPCGRLRLQAEGLECRASMPFSGCFDGRGHAIRNYVIHKHDSTSHAGLFPVIGEQGMICDLRLEGVAVVDVNDEAQASSRCGALAGENSGHIVGCSAEGDIECGGGLVGKNSGVILYSHAGGMARGGGLVRENYGTINACYATGDVLASPDSDSSTTSFAGGLVGVNWGTISDCYAAGAVPAYDYVDCHSGGLVGRNYTGKIMCCYASGAGGFALIGRGSALNCYFLRAADGGVDSGSGIGLTDAQMRRQESFVGWDFVGSTWDGGDETWVMPPNGGYPVLRAIEMPEFAGSGTVDDPYIIEARYQFLDLWRHPGSHFRLVDDIDLQGRTFTSAVFPSFWGYLDGNGHTLGNFTLTGGKDLGLFGMLPSESTVTNLNLGGVHITSLGGPSAALVACNRGKVLHCSASAEITVTTGSANYIAGLIGVNESGEVRECSVRCAMIDLADRHPPIEFCGGLVGQNTGIIAACRASSYINGGFVAFGALVGDNDGTVANSYADGHLYSHYGSPASLYNSFIGGLVGDNSGSVVSCYATTVVASPSVCGGLVGRDSKGTIASSYLLAAASGGGPDNGFGLVLTDAQMRQRASFAGWDFESAWTVCEGQDYPRLRWEDVACGQP